MNSENIMFTNIINIACFIGYKMNARIQNKKRAHAITLPYLNREAGTFLKGSSWSGLHWQTKIA